MRLGKLLRGFSFRQRPHAEIDHAGDAERRSSAAKYGEEGWQTEDSRSRSEPLSIAKGSVSSPVEENLEDSAEDIEQVLLDLAREHETKLKEEKKTPKNLMYTREEKQKLFLKHLFRISHKHIEAPVDADQASIVETDVGSLSVAAAVSCSPSLPQIRQQPEQPQKRSLVKDYLASLTSCLIFETRCGSRLQCELMDDHLLDRFDSRFSKWSQGSSANSAGTTLGSSLDRAFDGFAADDNTVSNDMPDHPSLHGDRAPRILRVPLSVNGDTDEDSVLKDTASFECTSTVSTTHHSARDL